jgi:TRAP-type C4-dicarboxylate transport system substrate-binding protein
MCSGAFWDKLNDEQKAWVKEASSAATKESRAVTIQMFQDSKKKVIADGALVTNFEDADIAAFRAIALPIQDKFAKTTGMEKILEMVRVQ